MVFAGRAWRVVGEAEFVAVAEGGGAGAEGYRLLSWRCS
jgi:hypothetical protein